MKHALIALLACAALWAQTSTAPAAAKAKAPAATATKAKATAKATAKAPPAPPKPDLLRPNTVVGKPPGIFVVRLETNKGNIDIRVVRNWAPNGVERFYNLVRAGFYDNTYFFRVLDFMAQVGISSNPAISKIWSEKTIFDDRVIQTNRRGMVTFASASEPNSRSTQFFINKKDANTYLDQYKFAPFGEVVEGMEVVDKIYSGYGEPPVQDGLTEQGEAFVNRNYPRMDKIIKASIIAVVEP
jgi:peptidyl-prolyl cis-trans isomerase A (cyclophilin A)